MAVLAELMRVRRPPNWPRIVNSTSQLPRCRSDKSTSQAPIARNSHRWTMAGPQSRQPHVPQYSPDEAWSRPPPGVREQIISQQTQIARRTPLGRRLPMSTRQARPTTSAAPQPTTIVQSRTATLNAITHSRIRKITKPAHRAAPVPTNRSRTVRPAMPRVNSSSIRNAAHRTIRKTILGSSPTGLRIRPRRNATHRTIRKTILGSSPTGLRIRPRRNAAHRTIRKTIFGSLPTGLRIRLLCNAIVWRARHQVRRPIRTRNPVPRSDRAPRMLNGRFQPSSTQLHSSIRPRRTPAGRLRHSMQVRLDSKVFRSDPLRKVGLAPTHALRAATTLEITVTAPADLRLCMHGLEQIALASLRPPTIVLQLR